MLDLCCGTGTIGLSLAHVVQKVIGIELIEDAIKDAHFNAKENGIENVEYIAAKVEQALPAALQSIKNLPSVAVVDPPRAGLHPDVIRYIRKTLAIEYLVYVSCHKSGLLSNSTGLCRSESKSTQGAPFRYGLCVK